MKAFRVYRSDGPSYVCNMAEGVTLKQAREYFCGNRFTEEDSRGIEHTWFARHVEEFSDQDKAWSARFTGRLFGAIGAFYPVQLAVFAPDRKAAELKIFHTYEHLQQLTITPL